MAGQEGFEPPTRWLTATEKRTIIYRIIKDLWYA
jgi:hypothetical protein